MKLGVWAWFWEWSVETAIGVGAARWGSTVREGTYFNENAFSLIKHGHSKL
jgi:hypothetical protein